MPVTVTVLASQQLVYSRYTGIILRCDIVTEMMRAYKNDDYQAGMSELVDLRRVTQVQIDYVEMSEHVRQASLTHRGLTKPIKVSFWAENSVAFGMARMFQSLSDALDNNIECFVTADRVAALAALDLPATALRDVLET